MALTVRPDDEVYQFDTVWLGPDEYTLPIQARYVAWGTWLACFLVAAVILIPLGGNGPAGVLGSLVWSLGLSVVLSRAVMLVVDHERPLRSLPAVFSAEARAAMQARRRGERSLLVQPGRVRVRETPPKVLAMRERQRRRAAAKADRTRRVEPVAAEPVAVQDEPARTPDSAVDGWHTRRTPAWSIRADEHDLYEPAPVPVPVEDGVEDDEVHEFVRAPDPETLLTGPVPEPLAEPPTGPPQVAVAAAPARPRDEAEDAHAALERRILLPARKDR